MAATFAPAWVRQEQKSPRAAQSADRSPGTSPTLLIKQRPQNHRCPDRLYD
jgi:hypothetical protein